MKIRESGNAAGGALIGLIRCEGLPREVSSTLLDTRERKGIEERTLLESLEGSLVRGRKRKKGTGSQKNSKGKASSEKTGGNGTSARKSSTS